MNTFLKSTKMRASLVALVESPPANAEDTGPIPEPGRFLHAEKQLSSHATVLSVCSRAQDPQLLSPRDAAAEACTLEPSALQQENPLQRRASYHHWSVAPDYRKYRKVHTATRTQHSQKVFFKYKNEIFSVCCKNN